MKLIRPSFEILEQEGYDRLAIEKFIERCARTCYKSEDKITEDSATQFIQKLINSRHYAMLEHGTVYLAIPMTTDNPDAVNVYINNKYSIVNECNDLFLQIFMVIKLQHGVLQLI